MVQLPPSPIWKRGRWVERGLPMQRLRLTREIDSAAVRLKGNLLDTFISISIYLKIRCRGLQDSDSNHIRRENYCTFGTAAGRSHGLDAIKNAVLPVPALMTCARVCKKWRTLPVGSKTTTARPAHKRTPTSRRPLLRIGQGGRERFNSSIGFLLLSLPPAPTCALIVQPGWTVEHICHDQQRR